MPERGYPDHHGGRLPASPPHLWPRGPLGSWRELTVLRWHDSPVSAGCMISIVTQADAVGHGRPVSSALVPRELTVSDGIDTREDFLTEAEAVATAPAHGLSGLGRVARGHCQPECLLCVLSLLCPCVQQDRNVRGVMMGRSCCRNTPAATHFRETALRGTAHMHPGKDGAPLAMALMRSPLADSLPCPNPSSPLVFTGITSKYITCT